MNIFEAIRDESIEKVKEAIENGADINEKDPDGMSVLMKIIDSNNFDNRIEAVKLLIDKGVLINEKNPLGWTALAFASKNNLLEIAELLIISGADVKANGIYNGDEGSITGNIAFLCAIYNRNDEMKKLLSDHGAK